MVPKHENEQPIMRNIYHSLNIPGREKWKFFAHSFTHLIIILTHRTEREEAMKEEMVTFCLS